MCATAPHGSIRGVRSRLYHVERDHYPYCKIGKLAAIHTVCCIHRKTDICNAVAHDDAVGGSIYDFHI